VRWGSSIAATTSSSNISAGVPDHTGICGAKARTSAAKRERPAVIVRYSARENGVCRLTLYGTTTMRAPERSTAAAAAVSTQKLNSA